MTNASLTDKIRTEKIAAIKQRQTLAVEAHTALIVALRNRLMCRPGCEDGLAIWGREPLPQRWTVTGDAQLSHTRSHIDHDEAREQARLGVPDEVRLLQPAVAVYPKHAIDVTPVPNGSDKAGLQRYRITVHVTLQIWVTETREADAYEAGRAIVDGHLPRLADAGITLTALRWRAADGPTTSGRTTFTLPRDLRTAR